MKLSKTITSGDRGDRPDFGVRLSDLEEQLGGVLTSVIREPRGDDPKIQAYDVYDVTHDEFRGDGVLLGLISAPMMRPAELELALDHAKQSGCAGVAIKDHSGDVQRCVHESGLACLVLTPEVSWREFDALLTRILGENALTLRTSASRSDKLFALANRVARVFGGSVAIEDHQRSILAHSSVQGQAIDELRTTGILFRRASDAPVNEYRYQQVLQSEGIVRFERYQAFLPRAAIALRAGAVPLGTIWALDPEGDNPDSNPLALKKEQVLLDAAAMATDSILESWQASNSDEAKRAAVLRRLVTGTAQPTDIDYLDSNGQTQAVMLVAIVEDARGGAARVENLRATLSRHLALYLPDAAIFAERDEVIAMCPTEHRDFICDLVGSALAELGTAGPQTLRIGVSDAHPVRSNLMYAQKEAREVARLSTEAGETIGTVENTRTQLFLSACQAQLRLDDRLLLPEVRQLLEEDMSGIAAIETFECWMQEVGSVSRTAKRLRVHEQTVRYRLRRLKETLQLGSQNRDYLLTLWVQLRAMRLSAR
jgi:hypothetical protein